MAGVDRRMKNRTPVRCLALALTGASGAPYFLRLLERVQGLSGIQLHLIASDAGQQVLAHECGRSWPPDLGHACVWHDADDMAAGPSSGSFGLETLVVLPCSMNTLCAVAAGITRNLVQRVASVQLKEGRGLVLVPREMPFSLIHLKAMVELKMAGATIMPASPSFYRSSWAGLFNPSENQTESAMALVDSVVDRVLDHLDLDDGKIRRWSS